MNPESKINFRKQFFQSLQFISYQFYMNFGFSFYSNRVVFNPMRKSINYATRNDIGTDAISFYFESCLLRIYFILETAQLGAYIVKSVYHTLPC